MPPCFLVELACQKILHLSTMSTLHQLCMLRTIIVIGHMLRLVADWVEPFQITVVREQPLNVTNGRSTTSRGESPSILQEPDGCLLLCSRTRAASPGLGRGTRSGRRRHVQVRPSPSLLLCACVHSHVCSCGIDSVSRIAAGLRSKRTHCFCRSSATW